MKLLLICLVVAQSCNIAGGSSNEVIQEIKNGNGRKAVLFIKYNGATSGNSLQVSIKKENAKIKNDEVGNIFTTDSGNGAIGEGDVIINWKHSDTLEIAYKKRLRTFVKESKLDDIIVLYKEVE
jgi:hypothetical protein